MQPHLAGSAKAHGYTGSKLQGRVGLSAGAHTHTHTNTALERKRLRSMALCVLRTSPVDGDDADTFFSNLPEAGPPANQTQRKP